MRTYTERAEDADRIYKTSVDTNELKKVSVDLAALIKEVRSQGQADSDICQDASSLLLRLRVKTLLLEYVEGGYYPDDMAALNKYIDANLPVAQKKQWVKTAELCERVRAYAKAVDVIMCDAAALSDNVRDRHGDALTGSVELLARTQELFESKLIAAGDLPKLSEVFSPRVKMPDITKSVAVDLNEMRDWCEKHIKTIVDRDAERFFAEHVKPLFELSEYGPSKPTYYPSVLPDSYSTANVIVLNTPFIDEAELALCAYSHSTGRQFGVLTGAELTKLSSGELARLFDIYSGKGLDCVIEGMSAYHSQDDRRGLYAALFSFGKAGGKVFITDDRGDRRLYDGLFSYAEESEGASVMDVTNVFLCMPQYSEFNRVLAGMELIPEGTDDSNVREKMMFCGYVGLNGIVSAAAVGSSWRNLGAELNEKRFEKARAYLAQLPSQMQLLDLGWGEFEVNREKRDERPSYSDFDYDSVYVLDPENIRRIVESPDLSVFEKCGGVALYCTLCGMDKSVWKDMPADDRAERINVATRFVARILSTSYVPEVRVVSKNEMEKRAPGAAGLCCDGGKCILFREDCVEDIDWLICAICHECYHAFQHTAIDTGWKQWHWDELGVTEGRIDRWANNFACYEGDVNSVTYKVEVVESDAVAFEKDCMGVAVKALTRVRFRNR